MARIRIEINERQWFDAEVEGYQVPPSLPDNPSAMQVSDLPGNVREVLDRAMITTLEKLALEKLGLRSTGWEHVG